MGRRKIGSEGWREREEPYGRVEQEEGERPSESQGERLRETESERSDRQVE